MNNPHSTSKGKKLGGQSRMIQTHCGFKHKPENFGDVVDALNKWARKQDDPTGGKGFSGYTPAKRIVFERGQR